MSSSQQIRVQSKALKKIKRVVIHNPEPLNQSVLIGIPSTGKIRFEWHSAMQSLMFPTWWAMSYYHPIGYDVATARNMIVESALMGSKSEWIFFIDHDVLVPEETPVILRKYMTAAKYPIVSGYYYTKSNPPEPLIYKAGQTGPYYNWKKGDKVWASGTGLGLTLIHTSIFRNMAPPWFVTPNHMLTMQESEYKAITKAKENTPWSSSGYRISGTEDIYFYNRVVNEGIINKAGWKVPDPNNPILIDTDFFGGHIDFNSGKIYPNCMGNAHMVNHDAALAALKSKNKKCRS